MRYVDPSGHNVMKVGTKGDEVKRVQEHLNRLGYNVAQDGSYGPKTAAAVKEFQKDYGIKVDGIVGNQTYTLLSNVSSTLNAPDAAKQQALNSGKNAKVGALPPGVMIASEDKVNQTVNEAKRQLKEVGPNKQVDIKIVNNQPQITGTSPRKDAVNSTPAPKPSTPAPIQPTKSTNTLAPPIVAPSSKSNSGFGTTLWNAVLGGWAGIDNNLAFGAFQNTFSAPTKEQQATKAYQFGKLAGDVVSIVVGGIELVVGGAGTATGIPMTGSVVLSGPGVLTTAASLAVADHGMNGMINGARGIGDSAARLFSSGGTGKLSPKLSELHTKLDELAEKHLLPQFREIDPNLRAGYTGSFKTGTVGNPNKSTFGQPIDLNKYDIDYYIESDILY